MNSKMLSSALREYARAICDDGCNHQSTAKTTPQDTSELLRVLANIVDGKDVVRSFGAPGDWGYGTPIGDALSAQAARPVPDQYEISGATDGIGNVFSDADPGL